MIVRLRHSDEQIEMDNIDKRHKRITEKLAISLVQRGYADIEWVRSAIEEEKIDVNSRDTDGKPLLQLLLQVPWEGQQTSDLEEGVYISYFKCECIHVISSCRRHKIAD